MRFSKPPNWSTAAKRWPQGPQNGYLQLHSWYRDRQGGRPIFALKHAIRDITDDYEAIIERRYYPSQTLDNRQVTMRLLHDGDHSVLTILTQTSTARAGGVARLIAVPIGRHMARRDVEPIFTTLREHFGA